MMKCGDKQLMFRVLLCIAYVILTVSGLILVKYASLHPQVGFTIPILRVVISKYSLIGLMCYGISFILYICVISQFDLGFIIPLVGGIVNILILVASLTILNESPDLNAIIGAAFIIVGIVIMNFKRG